MKQLKRANGAGSVYKLNGRRSKPYVAMITDSYKKDVETGKVTQKRLAIGYYKTADEAMYALIKYNMNPYEISIDTLTFEDLYNDWSTEHFKELSPSAIRTYKAAFMHLSPLHKRKFKDLRPSDLDECIKNDNSHSSTRKRMKSLCGILYKYAIKKGIPTINYAVYCDNIKTDQPILKRIPFSNEEIIILWSNLHLKYVDMILVGLYTGMRPGELCQLKISDINPKEHFMIGGSKTTAGINRIIPIHSSIRHLIRHRHTTSISLNSDYLFCSHDGKPISYYNYLRLFKEVMLRLNMNHLPHDTRHTFISLAKESGIDEYLLKIIVGHSIQDITERVYTHRNPDVLLSAVMSIKFPDNNAM